MQNKSPSLVKVATLDIEFKGALSIWGIKAVGREPSWCRPNLEYHKALAPFCIPS